MIWSTFEGFVLLDSLKGVFNLGKMSKGGGLGMPTFLEQFLGNFDHFRLFKSPRIKFSVQRLNTFLEAHNLTFYAGLLHFEKCCNIRVKVLSDCLK